MIRPEKLKLPKWIIYGIRHNHKGFPLRYKILAGDTETVKGEPYTLQLTDGDGGVEGVDLSWINKKNILKDFCNWMDRKAYSKHPIVFWFHNLEFDLTTIFYDHLKLFEQEEISCRFYGWTFNILFGKKVFGYAKKGNYRVTLLDTADFFRGSLSNVGRVLGCKHYKLKNPDHLGEYRLRTREFIDYAKTDALLCWEIGKKIIEFHKDWNIRLTVSVAQMASTIFRHRFVKKDERIMFPSMDCVRLARLSYHGGKNGFYTAPGVYENCSEIDIVSAYPYAMKSLPNFTEGDYLFSDRYIPGVAGIYFVTGDYPRCKYPVFMTHEGTTVKTPLRVERLAVTSYELEEAIKRDGFKLETALGYIWREGGAVHNPIVEYVDHFFERKSATSKTSPRYLFYKLMLNSLYGKFIQEIKHDKTFLIGENAHGEIIEIHTKEDLRLIPKYEKATEETLDRVAKRLEIPEDRYRTAGGLYNPFIASLITGFTRAHIHRLEHRYKSIHTSTDSIKTLVSPEKIRERDGLGGHKIEITGRCALIRNKLYLHYNRKGELKKYALHGFHGSVEQLRRMIERGDKRYTYKKVNKVRESLIQGLVPNLFAEKESALNYRGVFNA